MLIRISFALVPRVHANGGPLKDILPDGYPANGVAFLPRRREEVDVLGPEGLCFRTRDYSKLCDLSNGWFARVIGGYPSGDYYNILRGRDLEPERPFRVLMQAKTPEGIFFKVLFGEAQVAFNRRYTGRKSGIDESNTKYTALVLQQPKKED